MGAVQHLSIDIETYSDVDIGKAGLYKYAQSPAFRVLLLAYSLDGASVQTIDLTRNRRARAGWDFCRFDKHRNHKARIQCGI